jgi:2-oxoglutarate ferredoxin oxidoreductase subunit delta
MAEVVESRDWFVFKISIQGDQCKGCGLCMVYCKNSVLAISSKVNRLGYNPVEPVAEYECLGCRNCYLICPEAIIEIYKVD